MIDKLNKSSRSYKQDDTIVRLGDLKIGGGNLVVMAGPCSVESEEQIIEIAKSVKKSGVQILRGGAFKPRTSPYDFQGMKADGLDLLSLAKKETGLYLISEIVAAKHIDMFEDVDILQVGARNMQNFELLKELGRSKKPVLLKRGFSNTIEEWLSSAEYIMASGNENVILCERGIRTFNTLTRNTLDLASTALVKQISHLPIIVDPSHGTGISSLVEPMALAAIAVGVDGLMIEVHNDPANALSDGDQSIRPDEFDQLMKKAARLKSIL